MNKMNTQFPEPLRSEWQNLEARGISRKLLDQFEEYLHSHQRTTPEQKETFAELMTQVPVGPEHAKLEEHLYSALYTKLRHTNGTQERKHIEDIAKRLFLSQREAEVTASTKVVLNVPDDRDLSIFVRRAMNAGVEKAFQKMKENAKHIGSDMVSASRQQVVDHLLDIKTQLALLGEKHEAVIDFVPYLRPVAEMQQMLKNLTERKPAEPFSRNVASSGEAMFRPLEDPNIKELMGQIRAVDGAREAARREERMTQQKRRKDISAILRGDLSTSPAPETKALTGKACTAGLAQDPLEGEAHRNERTEQDLSDEARKLLSAAKPITQVRDKATGKTRTADELAMLGERDQMIRPKAQAEQTLRQLAKQPMPRNAIAQKMPSTAVYPGGEKKTLSLQPLRQWDKQPNPPDATEQKMPSTAVYPGGEKKIPSPESSRGIRGVLPNGQAGALSLAAGAKRMAAVPVTAAPTPAPVKGLDNVDFLESARLRREKEAAQRAAPETGFVSSVTTFIGGFARKPKSFTGRLMAGNTIADGQAK